MSGLLLIGVVLLWFWAAIAIAQMVFSKLKPKWVKSLVTFLAIAVLIPLPVADEIVGGFQFRSLCEAETRIQYDINRLFNKTVYSQIIDEVKLGNMTIPVNSYKQTFIDIKTHELLLSYKVLDAEGGWLSRTIHITNVNQPYTFIGHCGPGAEKVEKLLKSLNVTEIKKSSGE